MSDFTLDISVSASHESRAELLELLSDVAECSDHITCMVNEGSGLKFTIGKNGKTTEITFRAIPNGHEITSLLLAILNLDGNGKNFPDEAVCNRVKALKGPIHLVTYVSLTCTNCPDVVQALNAMTTLNPSITHEMVDGALYQDEVDALKIQGVPSVFADGKLLHFCVSTGNRKIWENFIPSVLVRICTNIVHTVIVHTCNVSTV